MATASGDASTTVIESASGTSSTVQLPVPPAISRTVPSGAKSCRADLTAEIWGPNGGYVASVALRAAAAHAAFDPPATFSCHSLSVARFDAVNLDVRTLRRTKRAESVAVSMTQDGTPVLEAIAWIVQGGDG